MEPHRQEPRKVPTPDQGAAPQAPAKTPPAGLLRNFAYGGKGNAAYQKLVYIYRRLFAYGAAEGAPSSPPVLTPEEEAIARRFLAEGGGEAKTRLHKKMQSGF